MNRVTCHKCINVKREQIFFFGCQVGVGEGGGGGWTEKEKQKREDFAK